jgi:prevent-host-death family protein
MAKKTFNVAEAKAHLSELIERAAQGEEIIVARAGKPRAKIVALQEPGARRRVPGRRVGGFRVRKDFDSPLPEEVLALFEGSRR